MKLHVDTETFIKLVKLAGAEIPDISTAKIEKDYWLTLFLKTLLSAKPDIVFKGGTSLSRCYGIIERFSEDIDINYAIPDEGSALSHKQGLVKAVGDVISQLGLHLNNPNSIKDTHEVNQYYIKYPRNFEDRSVKQFVIAETIVHIKSFPTEEKEMSCILYDYLLANGGEVEIIKYELQPFKLRVQSLERTFIDKVFALADYALSGKTTDHSRHIYDLYKIYPEICLDDDFKKLVGEVRLVRKGLRDSLSVRSNVVMNEVLKDIVDEDMFRFDYDTRTLPLLYASVRYSEAITVINRVIESGCFN